MKRGLLAPFLLPLKKNAAAAERWHFASFQHSSLAAQVLCPYAKLLCESPGLQCDSFFP